MEMTEQELFDEDFRIWKDVRDKLRKPLKEERDAPKPGDEVTLAEYSLSLELTEDDESIAVDKAVTVSFKKIRARFVGGDRYDLGHNITVRTNQILDYGNSEVGLDVSLKYFSTELKYSNACANTLKTEFWRILSAFGTKCMRQVDDAINQLSEAFGGADV